MSQPAPKELSLESTGPLQGVRVMEVAAHFQPFGTAILSDLGADVIKIENLPHGDPIRGYVGLVSRRDTLGWADSAINNTLEITSRGKRSVAMNLTHQGSPDVIYRLVSHCDVFFSNFRMRALEKWGLTYPILSRINPRLIYALVTGLGRNGPDRDRPAMDTAVLARGGLMSMMGEAGSPPPPWGIMGLADVASALHAAYAICAALFAREKTGQGQEIDTSLLGAQLVIGSSYLMHYLSTGEEPIRPLRAAPPNPLRNCYLCGDGKWLVFTMTRADQWWPAFCKALGIEELVDDPRFDSLRNRRENSAELVAIIDKVMAAKSRDEWIKVLSQHEVVFGAVQTYSEVAQDPQVLENEYITTIEHFKHGPMKVIGVPVHFSRTPGKIRAPAPELGQHTEEVLTEIAGYTWEELEGLKKQGIIM